MVGMIHLVFFNLLEHCGGPSLVAAVRERVRVVAGHVFRLDAAYDDEWPRLPAVGTAAHCLSQETAENALAEHFSYDARTRWPGWFQMAAASRSFVLGQPAFHNSLAASLSAATERRAVTDKFSAVLSGDDLIVRYRSPNLHCGLYKSMAARIIAQYGEQAMLTETQCQRAGAAACEIRIQWQRRAGEERSA